MESGPFENIKGGDYIIMHRDTEDLQGDSTAYLRRLKDAGRKIFSGMKSLGVPQDGQMYEILPLSIAENGDKINER